MNAAIAAVLAGTAHNSLTGLQGGSVGEYYHLTSAEYTGTGSGPFARQTSPVLVTPDIGIAIGTSLDLTGALNVQGNTTLGNAVTDTVTVNGIAGFQTTAVTEHALRVVPVLTGLALANYGIVIDTDFTYVSNVAESTALVSTSRARGSTNITGGTVGKGLAANQSNVFNFMTGTIDYQTGWFVDIRNLGAGTVTNVTGIWIPSVVNSGGGVVSNFIGLNILNQTVGSTSIRGIRSQITAGATKHNLYIDGAAVNGLVGDTFIGALTSQTIGNVNKLQIQGTGVAAASFGISKWSADALGSRIELGKSRGAAIGTNTIVVSGDTLASITAYGANGTAFSNAAAITFKSDGTPGASADMPGSITLSTCADASATLTDRWIVKSTGSLLAGTDNSWDIGAAGATRPRTGFFGTSVLTPLLDSGAAAALSIDTNTGTKQVEIGHTASASRYLTLTGSNGGNPTIGVSAGDLAIIPNIVGAGSIKTANPAGGTAAAWKLGVIGTGIALALDTTAYIEVDVGGTLKKLALAL